MKHLKFVFPIFVILLLIALTIPSKDVVIIEGKQKVVIETDSFSITYIHSVELFRCVELYEVKNGRLILTKTLTKSFGWGLPSEGNVTLEKDWFVYSINRTFKQIEVSTYKINDYTLEFKRKSIKLSHFGDRVLIRAEKINLLEFWRWKGVED